KVSSVGKFHRGAPLLRPSFDHVVCGRLSKGLQRLFAHDLRIVLAGVVELDELPGDRSVDIVVAIAGLQDDADQFECQTKDALGLRVEPLAVEIWANRHGYPPANTQAGTRRLSVTGAPSVNAAANDGKLS